MSAYRHIMPSGRRLQAAIWAAVVAGAMSCTAHGAGFGHSRLVSAVGQPLRIDIPVTGLTAQEAASLRATPASLPAWREAGLEPPVELGTLTTRLTNGHAPRTHILQVRSEQVFQHPIADLLIDVHTTHGVQRYQVSLLAQGGGAPIQAPVSSSAAESRAPSGHGADRARTSIHTIQVRKGDNMFAIAHRHAVAGVSVYQMMIALQRANPQAFIHENLNLVKAGATLTMPDGDALTAISDREARRLFHQQVLAFQQYRQSRASAGSAQSVPVATPDLSKARSEPVDGSSNVPQEHTAGDQLRLSSVPADRTSQLASATPESDAAAAAASTPKVISASSSSETVPSLTSGMGRAAHAASSDLAHSATAEEDVRADGVPAQGDRVADGARLSTTSPEASGDDSTNASGGIADSSTASDDGAPTNNGSATSDGTITSEGPATSDRTAKSDSPATSESSATSEGSVISGGTAIGDGSTTDGGAQADDNVATAKAIGDARDRVSQLEENVKNLNQALQSQGEAAKDLVVDGAIGLRQSLTEVATAVTDATIGDEDPDAAPAADANTGDGAAALGNQEASTSTAATKTTPANTMDTVSTWVQSHLLGVIVGALAFLVLVTVWALRHINLRQTRSEGAITPDMVREKLEQINLDLDSPSGDSPSRV